MTFSPHGQALRGGTKSYMTSYNLVNFQEIGVHFLEKTLNFQLSFRENLHFPPQNQEERNPIMPHEELGEISQPQYRSISELRQKLETRAMEEAEAESQRLMFEAMGGVDLCCLRFLRATDFHVDKAMQLVSGATFPPPLSLFFFSWENPRFCTWINFSLFFSPINATHVVVSLLSQCDQGVRGLDLAEWIRDG